MLMPLGARYGRRLVRRLQAVGKLSKRDTKAVIRQGAVSLCWGSPKSSGVGDVPSLRHSS
ncbi:MAG: hypothetical protein A2138_15925 [Deltaproteobacteria bacterium RBG_16_71_12]|nr:MAG: hypothetical protein A2138_15925 [Deltaproteobacteria bacterium RBG_16_71_12]